MGPSQWVSYLGSILLFITLSSQQGGQVSGQISPDGNGKLDLTFLIHYSSTASSEQFGRMVQFMQYVVQQLDVASGAVRVGAAVYGTSGYLQFTMDKYNTARDINNALGKMSYSYRAAKSNWNSAFTIVQKRIFRADRGDRADAKNVVLIVTDSDGNAKKRKALSQSSALKRGGALLLAVGVRQDRTSALNGLVTTPVRDNTFYVQDYHGLQAIRGNVVDRLVTVQGGRRQPVVAPTPPPLVTQRSVCSTSRADMVIVVDASTSVTELNFQLQLAFVMDLMKPADIDNGNVRVGLLTYSTDVYIQFHLNEYRNKDALIRAIGNVPYNYGSTNTADGLKTMHAEMFTRRNGDRPDVQNIAVILTDGVSNINSRRTIPEAEEARKRGITVYAVGIGIQDTRELDGIANRPLDKYRWNVEDFEALKDLDKQIYNSICAVAPTPKPTPPPKPDCISSRADMVIVVDASTSVTELNFQLQLAFVQDLMKPADIDNGNVRVGLLTYSTDVYIQFHLNEYSSKEELIRAIGNVPYNYGSTNTADGLKTMHSTMFTRQNGDRPDVQDIAVILTDGVSNINSRRTIPEAEEARKKGITVYAVGIGIQDTRELDGIANKPLDQYRWNVEDFEALQDIDKQIYNSICIAGPTLEPPPPPTVAPDIPPACIGAKADIVIVLDASTSVTEINFQLQLAFVQDLMKPADIDNGNVRVGLLTYSTDVYIQFHLNEYRTKAAVIQAIGNVPYNYGSTNTADALKSMRSEMFTRANGDRPGVPNICVVMTDGVSNINSRRTIPEADFARDDDITIYGLGIGLKDTRELDGISNKPLDDYRFNVEDFAALQDIDKQLYSSICSDPSKVTAAPARTTRPPRRTSPPAPTAAPWTEAPTPGSTAAPWTEAPTQRRTRPPRTSAAPRTEPPTTPRPTPGYRRPTRMPGGRDVVMVLDASMTEDQFDQAQRFANNFASWFDVDSGESRIGVMTYSSTPNVEFNLNRYRNRRDIYRSVNGLSRTGGNTNTARALNTARSQMFNQRNGDRPLANNVLILITGKQSLNNQQTLSAAERARNDGVHMYTIGLGLNDPTEIETIATQPARDNSWNLRYPNELRGVPEPLVNKIAGMPRLRPATRAPVTQPPTRPTPGDRRPTRMPGGRDVVMVLDSSMTEDQFDQAQRFANNFASWFDVDSGESRIGLMTYSSSPNVRFNLNRYGNRRDIYRSVNGLSRTGGDTDTARALSTARSQMFTQGYGDRPLANNVLILITGKQSLNNRQTLDEAQRARNAGIHMYTIGLGLNDPTEIETIATQPARDNSWNLRSLGELRGVPEPLVNKIAGMPQLTTPAPVTRPPVTRPTARPTPGDRQPTRMPGGRDVVMVLDASMTEDQFDQAQRFANNFASWFDVDSGESRVGLMTYSSSPRVRFNLNRYRYRRDIYGAVNRLRRTGGSTNTARALSTARSQMFTRRYGDRPLANNVLILITGKQSLNNRQTLDEAQRARNDGIHMYTIGLGLNDPTEIETIATQPARDNSWNLRSLSELRGVPEPLVNKIAGMPEMTTLAPTTRAPVTARPTPADRQPIRMPGGRDVVMVLDSSMPQDQFDQVQRFANNFASWFDVDSGESRIGVMTYSTSPRVQFNLNRYRNRRDIYRGVNNLRRTGGGTDTAEALRQARTRMFTRGYGDRPTANNVLLLITAKQSLNSQRTLDEAERARNDGIHMYTIGLGLDDTTEIENIANQPPRDNSYNLRVASELYGVPEPLANKIAGMPELTTPAPTTRATRPPRTRAPPKPTPPPREPAAMPGGRDVVIVLDSAMPEQQFDRVLRFANTLASRFDVDSGESRIGAMSYGTSPRVRFNLNRYRNRADVYRGINGIRWTGGKTNTALALRTARTRMFTRSYGDRPTANNILILITAKQSINKQLTLDEAKQAQNDGIHVYTIGLSLQDTEELDAIASPPAIENSVNIGAMSELAEIPDTLVYKIVRMPELTTPVPTTRARPTLPPRRTYPPYTGNCPGQGDIVFVLDSSGSVGGDNFDLVKEFILAVVGSIDIGSFRIGVISYSDEASIQFHLNHYDNRLALDEAVRKIPYVYGSTNTAAALAQVRNVMLTEGHGDRPAVPNLVVLVTDGQSNVNAQRTLPEARALKNTGSTILTVAVGFAASSRELEGLTSEPIAENLIFVANYTTLARVQAAIVTPLCTDSNQCTPTTCSNGGTCLDGLRSFVCICTRGFHGRSCEHSCNGATDIVFMMVSSRSVGDRNFEEMKSFVQRMIRDLALEACDIRIGVMKYNTLPRIEFNLGQHRDLDSILTAIDSIYFSRGGNNIALAIRALRNIMFGGSYGRRSARKIAYLFVDGPSDIERDYTLPETEMAHSSGIYVIPIGINVRNMEEMESIAHAQGIQPIVSPNFGELNNVQADALQPVFQEQDNCDPDPCLNGGSCANKPNGFECTCLTGWTGDVCQFSCKTKTDVVFIVDTSRYMYRRRLRGIKQIIRQLVRRMEFRGGDSVRAAVIDFADSAYTRITLENGRDRRNIMRAVSALRPRGGDPAGEDAFKEAVANVFRGANGDRGNAANVAFFFTAGLRNPGDVIVASDDLKAMGVHVIGVGIGLSRSDKNYLEDVVSSPAVANTFNVEEPDELGESLANMAKGVCEDEDQCSVNPCLNGGRCFDLKNDYKCECARGYCGRTCQKRCTTRADVVFLLDSSGSVGRKNFRKMQDFVSDIVGELPINTDQFRVGVATYGTRPGLGFYMNSYRTKAEMQDAVYGVSYVYGETNTAGGIRFVRNRMFNTRRGDRQDVQNILVILTDGLSNINSEATVKAATLIKQTGAHVFTIGIGVSDPWEVKAMATKPDSLNSFQVSDFDSLKGIYEDLVGAIVIDPSPCDSDPCRNSGKCVPGLNTYVCECPIGTVGDHCELLCIDRKDIAFIVDSSSSVGPRNFEKMMKFIYDLVEDFHIGSSAMRVALVTYSSESYTVFSLNRYGDRERMLEAVERAQYIPGATNTADGLAIVRKYIFNGFSGDRRDAENIAILLTDGQSNVAPHRTIPEAEKLRAAGVRIMGIGIALQDTDELSAIVGNSQYEYIVDNFASLTNMSHQIMTGYCGQQDDGSREVPRETPRVVPPRREEVIPPRREEVIPRRREEVTRPVEVATFPPRREVVTFPPRREVVTFPPRREVVTPPLREIVTPFRREEVTFEDIFTDYEGEGDDDDYYDYK